MILRGKRYGFRLVRGSELPKPKNKGERVDGSCCPPTARNKEIRIRKTLRGERLLEVIIHEVLHACFWDIDEDAIESAARDLARVLYRLGVRIDKRKVKHQ